MDAVLIDSIFDYSFGFLLGFSLDLALTSPDNQQHLARILTNSSSSGGIEQHFEIWIVEMVVDLLCETLHRHAS